MKKWGIWFRENSFKCLTFIIILVNLTFASVKLEVIVNNAHIKLTPEIGGENIAQVNIGTNLIGQEKQGEWYKIIFNKEGEEITGFIHEMLVKVVDSEEAQPSDSEPLLDKEQTQEEIIAEIEGSIEDSKKLIRQETQIKEAIESLSPLIAKLFKIEDPETQKKLAVEIYLWRGLGYAAQKKEYSALKEMKNMFEVDHSYALEISRNIYDPNIDKIISLAEKEYLGLIENYYLKISTKPQDAILKLNGTQVGSTPKTIKSESSELAIEIEKEGYETIKAEIFLVAETSEKEFILQKSGRKVQIRSIPSGAKIYLDGKYIDKETNEILPFLEFGIHQLKITKNHFEDWEEDFEVSQGQGPFNLEVTLKSREYDKVDQWGKIDTKFFEAPTGIARDNQGNFYIVDKSDLKIKKFRPEGVFSGDLTDNKRGLRKLKNPFGITVDSEGYLYVTDIKKHCVMKFDKKGNFVLSWGKEGPGDTEFNTPLGIALDSEHNVYVADSGNHKVKKFTDLGVLKEVWGDKGFTEGNFVYPAGIFVNKKNEVFVTDQTRLQKFNSNGEFILSWGDRGTESGQFDRPTGIFIDNHNYIYISDTYNHRIQKFDENGFFITEWGSQGIKDNQLNFPVGLLVDPQGLVYVVERDNNRIQIFSFSSK
jgi:DNA-binding beta-propeller fold protein YncE